MRKKRCIICGKPLTGKQQKYCSEKCQRKNYYREHKDEIKERQREYRNFKRDMAMAKERQPRVPTTKLEVIRIERNLSFSDLSKLSGVPKDVIASYERGETNPQANTILKLSKALNLSPWYLFQDEFYGDDASFIEEVDPLTSFVNETNATDNEKIKQAVLSILCSIDLLDPDGPKKDAKVLYCTETILDGLSTYLEVLTGRKSLNTYDFNSEVLQAFFDIGSSNRSLCRMI